LKEEPEFRDDDADAAGYDVGRRRGRKEWEEEPEFGDDDVDAADYDDLGGPNGDSRRSGKYGRAPAPPPRAATTDPYGGGDDEIRRRRREDYDVDAVAYDDRRRGRRDFRTEPEFDDGEVDNVDAAAYDDRRRGRRDFRTEPEFGDDNGEATVYDASIVNGDDRREGRRRRRIDYRNEPEFSDENGDAAVYDAVGASGDGNREGRRRRRRVLREEPEPCDDDFFDSVGSANGQIDERRRRRGHRASARPYDDTIADGGRRGRREQNAVWEEDDYNEVAYEDSFSNRRGRTSQLRVLD